MRTDDRASTSRRDLLKAVAAAGAGALLPAGALFAQNSRKTAGTNPSRIDVHHHFATPSLTPGPIQQWTPTMSLEEMDKYGVSTALLSHPGDGGLFDGTEKARTLARKVNEAGAKIVSDYPGRFGLLAVLPFRDVEGSVKEIEYAFDTLKADGFGITSNNGEKWPGDPALLPIFQEFNRRKAVVFVHPFVNKCCRQLVTGVADSVVEYDFDTTRAITSLLYNGVLSQCPDIRIIVTHSGACVPVLAGRIKDRVPGANTSNTNTAKVGSIEPSNHEGKNAKIPKGAYYEMKKLYYECAHASYPMPMAALMKFVGPSQLLFGTDFPAEPMETTIGNLPSDGLSPEVLRAMERGNAERLFPRLKSKT
jgi:predicted TIM-barrel fold metal-dependent hydrolase